MEKIKGTSKPLIPYRKKGITKSFILTRPKNIQNKIVRFFFPFGLICIELSFSMFPEKLRDEKLTKKMIKKNMILNNQKKDDETSGPKLIETMTLTIMLNAIENESHSLSILDPAMIIRWRSMVSDFLSSCSTGR